MKRADLFRPLTAFAMSARASAPGNGVHQHHEANKGRKKAIGKGKP